MPRICCLGLEVVSGYWGVRYCLNTAKAKSACGKELILGSVIWNVNDRWWFAVRGHLYPKVIKFNKLLHLRQLTVIPKPAARLRYHYRHAMSVARLEAVCMQWTNFQCFETDLKKGKVLSGVAALKQDLNWYSSTLTCFLSVYKRHTVARHKSEHDLVAVRYSTPKIWYAVAMEMLSRFWVTASTQRGDVLEASDESRRHIREKWTRFIDADTKGRICRVLRSNKGAWELSIWHHFALKTQYHWSSKQRKSEW